MFKTKEQVLGLQHITSTLSALPRLEECLLPHLVSVGSSHSLVLNPRPDLMGSSPFRNSFCPAFTFKAFGVLRLLFECIPGKSDTVP